MEGRYRTDKIGQTHPLRSHHKPEVEPMKSANTNSPTTAFDAIPQIDRLLMVRKPVRASRTHSYTLTTQLPPAGLLAGGNCVVSVIHLCRSRTLLKKRI